MQYIAIDLETTGLDPNNHDILQVAAAIDDTLNLKPLKDLPYFEVLVAPKLSAGYTGDPFALAMNHKILDRIAKAKGDPNIVSSEDGLAPKLYQFTIENGLKPRFVCAGKNFGSFDRQFLNRIFKFETLFPMKHRSLDPGSMFVRPDDTEPPSLDTILERMGVNLAKIADKRHEALFDCHCVIQAIRYAMNGMKWDGIPDNWNAI